MNLRDRMPPANKSRVFVLLNVIQVKYASMQFNYVGGGEATVSSFITFIILLAGVLGGLIIVICVILVCKYCLKSKKHSRRSLRDGGRESGRAVRMLQRYETINSDVFSEPSSASVDGIPLSPRKPLDIRNRGRRDESEEASERTQLRNSYDKDHVYDHQAEDILMPDKTTRLSDSSEHLPGAGAAFPGDEEGGDEEGRGYTEGDFHYLKHAKINTKLPRQFSLGPAPASAPVRALPLGAATAPAFRYSLDERLRVLQEHAEGGEQPGGDDHYPPAVNVEVHRQQGEDIQGLPPASPARKPSAVPLHVQRSHAYQKKATSHSLEMVRYNDTGSLEQLNEDATGDSAGLALEALLPPEESDDTDTLNGAIQYRELWHLRATLEEEEECSDTIRMEDMTSPDDSPEREHVHTTSFESTAPSDAGASDQRDSGIQWEGRPEVAGGRRNSNAVHFERRAGRTASKKRREYSRERQLIHVYEINVHVFTRFFSHHGREAREKYMARDYSIDEKTNQIFNEFLRQEAPREASGRLAPEDAKRQPGQRQQRELRAETLPSGQYRGGVRRRKGLRRWAGAGGRSCLPRWRWVTGDAERDLQAAKTIHEIGTTRAAIHDIPIIKLPEEDPQEAS
nr:hypothetical protein BaRGS_013377 [Batillaria attramentaria]